MSSMPVEMQENAVVVAQEAIRDHNTEEVCEWMDRWMDGMYECFSFPPTTFPFSCSIGKLRMFASPLLSSLLQAIASAIKKGFESMYPAV